MVQRHRQFGRLRAHTFTSRFLPQTMPRSLQVSHSTWMAGYGALKYSIRSAQSGKREGHATLEGGAVASDSGDNLQAALGQRLRGQPRGMQPVAPLLVGTNVLILPQTRLWKGGCDRSRLHGTALASAIPVSFCNVSGSVLRQRAEVERVHFLSQPPS